MTDIFEFVKTLLASFDTALVSRMIEICNQDQATWVVIFLTFDKSFLVTCLWSTLRWEIKIFFTATREKLFGWAGKINFVVRALRLQRAGHEGFYPRFQH